MSQSGSTSAQLSPSVPLQFTEDTGTAVPTSNNLNVLGGTSISTSGSGSTVTIDLTANANNSILSSNGAGNPTWGTSLSNDYTFTTSTAGVARTLTVSNTDNTSSSSFAIAHVSTGGRTSRSYCVGPDNGTTNDPWKLRTGANDSVTPESGGGDETLIAVMPTGEVTQPLNPCVTAYLNASTTNATGDGTFINPIIFDVELFDQNSNYNPSTGLFTVPIDGKYLVTACVTFNNLAAGHTAGEVRLIAGWVTYRYVFNPGVCRDSNNMFSKCISQICSMTAGQTASIVAVISGSTKTVGAEGESFGIYSNVSFELIS